MGVMRMAGEKRYPLSTGSCFLKEKRWVKDGKSGIDYQGYIKTLNGTSFGITLRGGKPVKDKNGVIGIWANCAEFEVYNR